MKTIFDTAHQILNAMTFANAGNQREFEELLSRSSRVESELPVTRQASTRAVSEEDFLELFTPHGAAA